MVKAVQHKINIERGNKNFDNSKIFIQFDVLLM